MWHRIVALCVLGLALLGGTAPQAHAGLTVTNLSPSRTAQAPGGRLLLNYTLENQTSSTAKNIYVRFYFTPAGSSTLTGPPLTDTLVLCLEPGQPLHSKVALRLPANTPLGPGQFVAIPQKAGAAPLRANARFAATPGTTTAPFTVGDAAPGLAATPSTGTTSLPSSPTVPASDGSPIPDASAPTNSGTDAAPVSPETPVNLLVVDASVEQGTVAPDQAMLVPFSVRNTGGQEVGPLFIAFCIVDDTGRAVPDQCPDRQMIQSIGAGAIHGSQGTVLLPRDIATGPHTLAVIVDFDDMIRETDETDNARLVRFTVSPQGGNFF